MIEFQTSNIWKYVAVGLISIGVTSVPSYIILVSNTTDQEDVKRLILENSPYNNDQKLIMKQINSNTEVIKNINIQLNKIHSVVNKNSGKLDTIQHALFPIKVVQNSN